MIKVFLMMIIYNFIVKCANNNPTQGIRVQALQQQITRAIGIDLQNYKLYPFAIIDSQQFSIYFKGQQKMKAQIKVNWIDVNRNQLTHPIYDDSQYIRLAIIDENMNKTIQERKFHFQTGIQFDSQPDHRYRIVFNDYGNQSKMIQLALSDIQTKRLPALCHKDTLNKTIHSIAQIKQISNQINSVIIQNGDSNIQKYGSIELILSHLHEYLIFSIWEIVLIVSLMLCQIVTVSNLIKQKSSYL